MDKFNKLIRVVDATDSHFEQFKAIVNQFASPTSSFPPNPREGRDFRNQPMLVIDLDRAVPSAFHHDADQVESLRPGYAKALHQAGFEWQDEQVENGKIVEYWLYE